MRTAYLVAAVLALSLGASAQAPTVYVQWTRLHPQGWEAVSDWAALPKKVDPTPAGSAWERRRSLSPVDDEPGWVAAVKIESGGRTTVVYGCDQYVVKIVHGDVYSYCWVMGRLDLQRISGDDKTWWLPIPSPAEGEIRHGKYVDKPLWWEHMDKVGLPHPGGAK